jgi:tetratricopeptide (TPR) repeat protein
MPDSCPTNPEGRNAFTIAASILGLFALGQVAAVVLFVANYAPTETSIESASAGDDFPLINRPRTRVRPAPPAPMNRTRPVAIAPIDPSTMQPPVPETSPAPGTGITDEIAIQNKSALTYLDKGMHSRDRGDMRGALIKFRAAAALEPNHPRVLYEFAMTFEQMGLTEKATQTWRSIYELGQVRAGDYFLLADFRLKGKQPKSDTESIPEPSNQSLKIARAVAERDLSVTEGERVVLNVLISALPGSQPNPQDVHVRVDFYDIVNEASVDLTRAVPSNRWITQPVDWQGQSEELLEVAYFLPPQTDSDILEFGQRKYHGYVIRVYYRDQVQDVVAEPRALLDVADRPADPFGPAGAIDDKSLFPQ